MKKVSTERFDARIGVIALTIYTAAIFLSAFLLFAVQPMFTRMVLPRLGGSPSVWSVAMVFFQLMLLTGYAYAHWLAQTRYRLVSIGLHLALLCAAGLTLPLAIAQGWGEPPESGTAFWLLGLFALSIGIPFFALSANNPLLQVWFVRTGHRDGVDPYFLYATSNIGSFLALLSYPLLLEPTFTLTVQDRLWSIGFLALIVLIAGCAFLQLSSPHHSKIMNGAESVAQKPRLSTIGRWIGISAVPAGLLVAVTAHISTDVAAAPLLWVVPLSIYLLTWVLVFAPRPLIPHRWMLLLQPLAVSTIVVLFLLGGLLPLLPRLTAHLVSFFIIAMACHGQLAATRPAPTNLTVFYLSLSFGGMLGGLFAGLIAPLTFSWVAEYPILTVLAVLCRPSAAPQDRIPKHMPECGFWIVTATVALALILPSYFGYRVITPEMHWGLLIAVLTLVFISVALLYYPAKSAVAVALALAIIRLYPVDEGRSKSVRDFFAVNKIVETPDRQFRLLINGSIIHGAEQLLADDGKPITARPEPLTYYHPKSAIAAVINALRGRKGAPLNVAVIGLGVGSLACYILPGDSWRFFEIDPAVIAIATDPKLFSFVSSCAPNLPIVRGDARLTMNKEPDGAYDLIVVDAYSSDAIPIHLATREAMAVYKKKLAQHGVVLMHVSNRYLELESVVVGIAAANGLKTWVWANGDDKSDHKNFVFESQVVISAESAADIGALSSSKSWVLRKPDPAVRTWTDDYSNIVGAILRRL